MRDISNSESVKLRTLQAEIDFARHQFEARLTSLYESGVPIRELAEILGEEQKTVYQRIWRLRARP